MLLRRDLQSLVWQRQARQQDIEDEHYQSISYELMPLKNDQYEAPLQRSRLQCRSRPRLSRYQSIDDDQYDFTAKRRGRYEDPLQRAASSIDTEYQVVSPYEKRKEGCICRYCEDLAAKKALSRSQEAEGVSSTLMKFGKCYTETIN
jgi:hypothetical protein